MKVMIFRSCSDSLSKVLAVKNHFSTLLGYSNSKPDTIEAFIVAIACVKSQRLWDGRAVAVLVGPFS